MLGIPLVRSKDTYSRIPIGIISYILARRLVSRCCMIYLTYAHDVCIEIPFYEFILVVREFMIFVLLTYLPFSFV